MFLARLKGQEELKKKKKKVGKLRRPILGTDFQERVLFTGTSSLTIA